MEAQVLPEKKRVQPSLQTGYLVISQDQKGDVEIKLEKMREIIFSCVPQRYGLRSKIPRAQKAPLPRLKFCSQQEIKRKEKLEEFLEEYHRSEIESI